jgi:hypothetical protein
MWTFIWSGEKRGYNVAADENMAHKGLLKPGVNVMIAEAGSEDGYSCGKLLR